MKKIMKRMMAVVILIMCVFLSSCLQTEWTADGVENFHSVSNENEVDWYLMPSDDFITKFPALESDYHYYSKMLSIEKSFIYFKYSEEEYTKAYEYVKSSMDFVRGCSFKIDDYTFLIQDVQKRAHNENATDYPTWFWMMFYSREKRTIGFFGYFNPVADQTVRVDEDFRGFVETEFPYLEW